MFLKGPASQSNTAEFSETSITRSRPLSLALLNRIAALKRAHKRNGKVTCIALHSSSPLGVRCCQDTWAGTRLSGGCRRDTPAPCRAWGARVVGSIAKQLTTRENLALKESKIISIFVSFREMQLAAFLDQKLNQALALARVVCIA